MKLAVILHGNVGQMIPTGTKHRAIRTNRSYNTYEGALTCLQEGCDSFKKIETQGFEVDYFIHSWSKKLEKEIVELYNPVDYLIEEQVQFKRPEVMPPYRPWMGSSTRYHTTKSRFVSLLKALEVFEKNTGPDGYKEYDYVFISRFDVIFKRFLKPEIMLPYSYISFWKELEKESGKYRDFRSDIKIHDFWLAILPKDIGEFYSSLKCNLDDYLNLSHGGMPSAHYVLKALFDDMNLPLRHMLTYYHCEPDKSDFNMVRDVVKLS